MWWLRVLGSAGQTVTLIRAQSRILRPPEVLKFEGHFSKAQLAKLYGSN